MKSINLANLLLGPGVKTAKLSFSPGLAAQDGLPFPALLARSFSAVFVYGAASSKAPFSDNVADGRLTAAPLSPARVPTRAWRTFLDDSVGESANLAAEGVALIDLRTVAVGRTGSKIEPVAEAGVLGRSSATETKTIDRFQHATRPRVGTPTSERPATNRLFKAVADDVRLSAGEAADRSSRLSFDKRSGWVVRAVRGRVSSAAKLSAHEKATPDGRLEMATAEKPSENASELKTRVLETPGGFERAGGKRRVSANAQRGLSAARDLRTAAAKNSLGGRGEPGRGLELADSPGTTNHRTIRRTERGVARSIPVDGDARFVRGEPLTSAFSTVDRALGVGLNGVPVWGRNHRGAASHSMKSETAAKSSKMEKASAGSSVRAAAERILHTASAEARNNAECRVDAPTNSPSADTTVAVFLNSEAAFSVPVPVADIEDVGPAVGREVFRFLDGVHARSAEHAAKVRIHPPEFGSVSMNVRVKERAVSIELTVENRDVKLLLEARVEGLRAELSEKGFSLEHFDVGTQNGAKTNGQADQAKHFTSALQDVPLDEDANALDGLVSVAQVLTENRVNLLV